MWLKALILLNRNFEKLTFDQALLSFRAVNRLRGKPSSETQGQIVGPKTKIKTGGKKFDEQKYERKIRAPGDNLSTLQFQTAERILAPDWAEKFSSNFFPPVLIFVFGPTICPWVSEDGGKRETRESKGGTEREFDCSKD